MARRYDSEAVRNRVLSTSVRLFLERGYHGTTMAAILKEADVSSSSFQNVFGNKDGVMYELMKLMFSEQFSAADSAAALLGPNASPAFAYALETSVQLTIAELSEIIRDLYFSGICQRTLPGVHSPQYREASSEILPTVQPFIR